MTGWVPALLGAFAALLVTVGVLVVVDVVVRERRPALADYAVIVLCTVLFIVGAVLLRAPDLVPGVMTPGLGGAVAAW